MTVTITRTRKRSKTAPPLKRISNQMVGASLFPLGVGGIFAAGSTGFELVRCNTVGASVQDKETLGDEIIQPYKGGESRILSRRMGGWSMLKEGGGSWEHPPSELKLHCA